MAEAQDAGLREAALQPEASRPQDQEGLENKDTQIVLEGMRAVLRLSKRLLPVSYGKEKLGTEANSDSVRRAPCPTLRSVALVCALPRLR